MSPKHIGLIMDGNRRYAKKHGISIKEGYELGPKVLEDALEWAIDYDIKEVSIYAFSIQNFNRPKAEVEALFQIFKHRLSKYYEEETMLKKGIKIRFVGRLHMFPDDIQELMNKLMEQTKECNNIIANLATAYGGREEIIDATKKIIEDNVDKLDEDKFKEFLQVSSDIDLVIRTGNETRSSNFFPFQTTYAEWFYLDIMWPEFNKDIFDNILAQFNNKSRRFGR